MSRFHYRAGVAAALAAGLLLAGCAHDRTHFYTLLPPPHQTASSAGGGDYAIDVQRVNIPPQVDQPELIVRQGSGELALVETRRWIGPLADEVRGALSSALTQQLGVQDVSGVAPPDAPVYRVLVDVRRFEGWLAHDVTVDAVWTVTELGAKAADGKPRSWTCSTMSKQAVAPGYAAYVSGAQQGVTAVATQIGALIRAAQQAPSASAIACPAA
ncbi:PqiC family protein [Solimonas marina]|uniref:Membrane integrity-associated transporter subunit PqiC n=1 Tax=Solimonas marina TaxID=2714601 RepID=A0A969WCN7_9GAMM|nr:PqiC family protein [Solimonas marina]NKF23665.1 membrane integrity-associated transporter subunit PqiC [Solimonas marina]